MKRIIAICLLVAFAAVSAVAQITVMPKAVRQIDETRQVCFFTVTYEGKSFDWWGNTPILTGIELVNWLNARKETLALGVVRKLYPGSDYMRFKTDKNTGLQAMIAWIQDGHKNKVQIGIDEQGKPVYGYMVVEKVEWKAAHPAWVKLDAQIDAATTIEQMKAVLRLLLKKIK